MSRLSPFPSFRADSRASVAASDTTYHTCGYQSFNDVELYAPSSPPSKTPAPAPASSVRGPPPPPPPPTSSSHQDHHHPRPDHYPHHKDAEPETAEMRRQDSGYESLPPRSSFSNPRRASTASSSQSSSSHPRSRGRPTIRRAPKTSPYPAAARTSGSSLYHPQQQQRHSAHSQPPVTFFHFPAHPTDLELAARRPREDLELENRGLLPPPGSSSSSAAGARGGEGACAEVASPLPPQATHYWTSDRTRRLEYAAIDAASRGVKGWVRRHLVPDCFVPKEKHVAFDDDTGSVRRYRLELDEETAPCEKRGCGAGVGAGRGRGWFGWKRSKTA
ncbi:hypothetical protein LX32DRAFT_118526 [Colletotrichum zoysiae]|uniref:Uncharacterized protein n=1 Tax=Colletotrichum zoysiae TaxID=1216348 RepID=A0AAD9HQ21_9PEZI|nr:hypothetical protein LX32DRAFT_118526 [Colletotrichum zoysiae]